MRIPVAIILLTAGLGCHNPEMIQITPGVYQIFKEAHVMGWGNLGNLKAEVFAEANAFAASKGKQIEIQSEKEAPPAFGKYAFYELRFTLTDIKK